MPDLTVDLASIAIDHAVVVLTDVNGSWQREGVT